MGSSVRHSPWTFSLLDISTPTQTINLPLTLTLILTLLTLTPALLTLLLTLTLIKQGRGNIRGGIVQRELSVLP